MAYMIYTGTRDLDMTGIQTVKKLKT